MHVQRSRRRNTLVAGVAISALLLAGGAPAFASSDSDADTIADVVEAAAPTSLEAVGVERIDESLSAALPEGGAVELGVDPTGGLTFAADTGDSATVSLPGAARLSDAVVSDDGSVTFVGNEDVPSVNVMTAAGKVRVSTVIASAEQPEEYSYDFGVGATVELQDDGSALVTRESGTPNVELIVAIIDAPWATDAAGKAVDTSYVANGSVLTQVVSHWGQDVTYPVVADPSFDQPNIFQFRVRFNRAETKTIAQFGLASLGGAVCGPMAAACILAAGAVAYNAGVAENSNPKRCVQITGTNTYTPANIVWWVDTYRGGPCK